MTKFKLRDLYCYIRAVCPAVGEVIKQITGLTGDWLLIKPGLFSSPFSFSLSNSCTRLIPLEQFHGAIN